MKFRSKCNYGFTNHGYLHGAVWKALYNFKIKRAQEARHNQFFFIIFKIMRYLRSSECLVKKVELTSRQTLVVLGLLTLFSPENTLLNFSPKSQN